MRTLARLHRYAGIALAIPVGAWFVSGIVMLFVPYPALTDAERFEGLAVLSLHSVRVPAALAPSAVGVERVHMTMVMGRPTWHVQRAREVTSYQADSLAPLPPLSIRQAERVAADFAGAMEAIHLGRVERDQWTVHERLDPWRPLHRVRLPSPQGRQLYVSSRTEEVLRDTTDEERGWNYAGAVVHWIYPTVLRQDRDAWRQVVIWLSAAALLTAAVGVWPGLVRLHRRRTPYAGWMAWHHVAGLVAAPLLLAWLFSGMLSVNPGGLFSGPGQDADVRSRYRGGVLELSRFVVPLGPALVPIPRRSSAIGIGRRRKRISRSPHHLFSAGADRRGAHFDARGGAGGSHGSNRA